MNNFVLLEKIGEGAYSTVNKVRRVSDNQIYALKKVKIGALKDKERQNALNEIRILASIEDESIVGYKEAFFDDQSCELCIIMQLAENGDLQNKIKEHQGKKQFIKEREIWKMLYQITKGLSILHSMSILHRDIKCANVFLTDQDNYQLGDMNVSKVAKRGMVYTDEAYDSKSDIWSLGCVTYEMAALKPPFRAQDMEQLYKKVQKGICDRIPNVFSGELMQIISSCLMTNPKSRPSAAQLMKHPIFVRNTQEFQNIDYTDQPDILGKNILLDTINMPFNLNMNMRQLTGKLPKAKYSLSTNGERSFHNQSRGRSLLPQITRNSQPKNLTLLTPSKPINSKSQSDKKQLVDIAQIGSRLHLIEESNRYKLSLQDKILQEKLAIRQRNMIGVNPVIQNARKEQDLYQPILEQYHKYNNSSSSQIQNSYADKQNSQNSRPALPKVIYQKPNWWG